MKTEFKLLRVLLLSALFLGGCGAHDAPGLEEDGIAHLTYWSSQNPGERRLAVELVDAWNRANPDVQVTVQPLPAGQSSEEVLLAAVVAGTTPDVCSNIWPGIVSDFVRAAGVIALDSFPDFDSVMAARVPGDFIERLRAGDGHIYQIPWKANPIMMQYNVRMFREYGIESPPRTYSEYLLAAEKISRDLDGDGQFDQWIGYRDIQPIWHQRFFDYYAFYIAASGGRTLFEKNELRIDREVSNTVLGFFQELYTNGYFPRSKLQSNPFIQETVATDFVGPWNIAWLEENAPAELEFAHAPLPLPDDYQGESYTYGDYKNITIFSNTRYPEAAWRFAKHLISKEADLRLIEIATQLPIRAGLLEDPFFEAYFAENPRMVPFARQLMLTRGIEDVRSFPEMLDAISAQYEAAAVYGLRSPEEATARAIERIKELQAWYE